MSIQSVDGTELVPQVLSAESLLGYVAGNSFVDYAKYARARPDLEEIGWIVSVTLTCIARARMYDIEAGGGQNKNIGIFMHNADRTHGLPWLYTFASNVEAMINAAARFGYHQGKDYYVYAAHPNSRHGMHICAPNVCGFPKADGTQYLFAGSYDRGILNDYMLPSKKKSKPQSQFASGDFGFEGVYHHDEGKVTVRGAKGNVKSWGSVNEDIHLDLVLPVGPKPGRGVWRQGSPPRATRR